MLELTPCGCLDRRLTPAQAAAVALDWIFLAVAAAALLCAASRPITAAAGGGGGW